MKIQIKLMEISGLVNKTFEKNGKQIPYAKQYLVGRTPEGFIAKVSPSVKTPYEFKVDDNLEVDFSRGSYSFDRLNYNMTLTGQLVITKL